MGPKRDLDQIRKIGPEWAREMKQNLDNPYQVKDNKASPLVALKGAALRAAPLGFAVFIW